VGKISIENLKGITRMEFAIPETKKVYLIVGPNGVGKSSLLICLDRICNSYAFAENFKSSRIPTIDQYNSTTIKYEKDEHSAIYRKGPARWVSTPRENSYRIFHSFGFSRSIFIRADSKRIDPKPAEIRDGRIEEVNVSIISCLNRIFETNKYNVLKHLRISNGRGRAATYFYTIHNNPGYYSEKRFSSGEIAVIRLIEQLFNAPDNALVLLDEAEMALHPRVQANLLEFFTGTKR
jgi:AAA15 family ATPase/GTPase